MGSQHFVQAITCPNCGTRGVDTDDDPDGIYLCPDDENCRVDRFKSETKMQDDLIEKFKEQTAGFDTR